MSALAAQVCTKCGETKAMDAYGIRHDRGQPYKQCRDCMAERKWYVKNPERQKALTRSWQDRNPDRMRAIWRDMAERKRRNPAYRIHSRISCQIWHVLADRKGGRSAEELVGYKFDTLRSHLERQFVKGMGWHNMGEWHIDHIVPLSSFEIAGPDDPELRRAWALSNLRPLWAVDNIAKSNKRTSLL